MPDSSQKGNSDFECRAQGSLDQYLKTGAGLAIEYVERPDVSIVIFARNPACFLFSCLEALGQTVEVGFEIIVVAGDEPGELIDSLVERIGSVEIVRLPKISSFAEAWNRGAKAARGAHLIFLKDDVCVFKKALSSTVALLEGSGDIGAVGAQLLDREGVLIEAGSILESDGHCRAVGKGWNPDDYRVQYRREVAFCSGAYLGIPKADFDSLGGFDESYWDEYYEDVDLCLRLRRSGKRIIYDPGSVAVRNLEHRYPWGKGSALMEGNRKRLVEHREFELSQVPATKDVGDDVFFERARGQRILWVEDAPPFLHMGAGFPRTREMLLALIELGHSVTLLPTFITASDFVDVYRDTPREVEVALGVGLEGFASFWERRSGRYDTVIVSRPNNLKAVAPYIEATRENKPNLRFIYDAEAIFVNREVSERRCTGDPYSEREIRDLLEGELAPARTANAVFAISEEERNQFKSLEFSNIIMLRHHSRIQPTPRPFAERKDILFVGAVHSDSAPNALGLIDFIDNVLPLIRAQLGEGIKLYCAGKYHSNELLEYASESEVFLGFVDDLDTWYDQCRLFIAPAKFAAGIPLKIIEASSRGIPVVGTVLAQSQLGWSDGEMLAADSPEAYSDACVRVYSDERLWDQLREGALNRVRSEYSRERIVDALQRALK